MFYFATFLFGLISSFRADGRGRGMIQYCRAGEVPQPTIPEHISKDSVVSSSSEIDDVEEILMLPSSTSLEAEVSRTINLGETISLEELGPIIINADGTTRRITNWSGLTKIEQENSWRVISARNLKRLKKLQEKAAEKIAEDFKSNESEKEL
jgi:hypothetical protein